MKVRAWFRERFVFEDDRWFWEDIGIQGQWYWGSISRLHDFRFHIRYPDKLLHAAATFFLAFLWVRRGYAPSASAIVAFLLLWLGLEILPNLVKHRGGPLWVGSYKDALADALGALAAFLLT